MDQSLEFDLLDWTKKALFSPVEWIEFKSKKASPVDWTTKNFNYHPAGIGDDKHCGLIVDILRSPVQWTRLLVHPID